jgi:hypothetical protein
MPLYHNRTELQESILAHLSFLITGAASKVDDQVPNVV